MSSWRWFICRLVAAGGGPWWALHLEAAGFVAVSSSGWWFFGCWPGESGADLVSCYPPVAVRGPYPGGSSGVCALGEREERKQRREKEGKGGKEGEERNKEQCV